MNATEIRADMVAELRGAARGCEHIGVRNMQLAGTCRSIARQLSDQADEIESKIFGGSAQSSGVAGDNIAEPLVSKLNSAASPSADFFTALSRPQIAPIFADGKNLRSSAQSADQKSGVLR